tara:strand:- start:14992 stop:15567 length:576 start_codon:yes stop_codon:yes gene_type:complete
MMSKGEKRMAKEKTNYFTELDKVNVTEEMEKKGQFNYLSWAYAVRELKKRHPETTWEVHEFGENKTPFIATECGYFVKVTVTVEGVPATQVHPVLDNRNKTIEKPNAFQINTSIQRCLAKAIALHGLGIHIFAGEDLPSDFTLTDDQSKEFISALRDNKKEDLIDTVKSQISLGKINKGNFHKAMEHYVNS